MISVLMREYPHLDQLMAETLVKAYEQGTLESYSFEEGNILSYTPSQTNDNCIINDEKNNDSKESK